jgi:hypothetical protein
MILIPLLNLAIRRLSSSCPRRGGWCSQIYNHMRRLRHQLFPANAERNREYLEGTLDRYDPEHRIRQLDRVERPARPVAAKGLAVLMPLTRSRRWQNLNKNPAKCPEGSGDADG